MGLFVDRQFEQYSSSSNNTNFVNTNCGQYYGGYSFGHMLLESIPSLFMMGLQQFGETDSTDKADGKGGSTKKANGDDISNKINEKNAELTTILSQADVSTNSQLTSKISALDAEIKSAELEVSGDKSSASIQSKIDKYIIDNADFIDKNSSSYDPDYESGLASLEQAKADAIQKETDLNAKKIELARLETIKGQADNINNEIIQLKGQAIDADIKYNVEKETQDIKSFMSALKDFQAAKTDEEKKAKGQALINAYKNGDAQNGAEGVQQSTVTKAYNEILVPQLKAIGLNP